MCIEETSVSIRDLGLAAALVSCGFEITQTYRDEDGRTYFLFAAEDGLKSSIDSYWADTLVVRARKLSDNIKILKGVIYADK